jgi:S-adenosyl methyltransferase
MPATRQEAPDVSRLYDWLTRLGDDGQLQDSAHPGHSQPPDRVLARTLIDLEPGLPARMRLRRSFVATAVRRAAEAGCARVIDVGGGYPGEPPVHAAAREVIPQAQAVYVSADVRAMAVTRSRFRDDPQVEVTDADPADPGIAARLAAFPPPVVILRRIHLYSPAGARALVKAWADPMPAGTRLVTYAPCHVDLELAAKAGAAGGLTYWNYHLGDLEEVLSGLELEWPGVSSADAWLHGMSWVPDLPVYDLAVVAVVRR